MINKEKSKCCGQLICTPLCPKFPAPKSEEPELKHTTNNTPFDIAEFRKVSNRAGEIIRESEERHSQPLSPKEESHTDGICQACRPKEESKEKPCQSV